MKKLLCCLMIVMLLPLAAIAEDENWYLETAKDAAVIGELVHDDSYLAMMTTQRFDVLEDLKKVNYSSITAAWRYTSFDQQTVETMLGLMSGGELTETGLSVLASKFPQTLLSVHTGSLGAEKLAVVSMLNYSYTDLMPENFEPCFVLLSLGNGAVAVSFNRTGENTITVQAQPYFYDENLHADEAVKGFTPFDLPVFPIKSEKLL